MALNFPFSLQNLIEKVMILKKAVEKERRQVVKATNSHVSEMLWYAAQFSPKALNSGLFIVSYCLTQMHPVSKI
jgi:hypothetical protein